MYSYIFNMQENNTDIKICNGIFDKINNMTDSMKYYVVEALNAQD